MEWISTARVYELSKMLINAIDVEECRVAIVENGFLEEFSIETPLREQIKGNIYKGNIVKIEPSLQAAFVDFGGNRAGFLPFSEVHPDFYSPSVEGNERPRIQEALKKRQEIIVQVVKGEIGKKGAALTTYISLPGRYLVLMPGSDVSGVSRKIENDEQRRCLKEIVAQLNPPEKMGFIVRTAGLDKGKSELARDYNYLMRLWESIEDTAQKTAAPALVYQESDVVVRSIRDYFSPDIEETILDSREAYKRARDFMRAVMPRYQKRLKLYREKTPIFSFHHIEDQIESISQRQISLKSGGSIVIEPTEALVSIDVNSGRSTQSKGIEETAYRTNLEAANEIARQLRLRDLGGLIVIDFIDMKDRKHQQEIERMLRNALRKDKARVQVGRISRFGMLELSRQRIKPALQEGSYKVCPYCTGNGLVKTVESQVLAVLRRIQTGAQDGTVQEIRVVLPQDVANYLLNQKREELFSLEEDSHIEIHVLGEEGLMPHQAELEFIRRELTVEEGTAREGASQPVSVPEIVPQPEPKVSPESSETREPGQRRRSRRGHRRRREQPTSGGYPGVQETSLFTSLPTREEPTILSGHPSGQDVPLLEPPLGQEPLFPSLEKAPPAALPDTAKLSTAEVVEVSKEPVPIDQSQTAEPFGHEETPTYTFPQRRGHGLLFWMGRRRAPSRGGEEKVEITYEDEPSLQESSGSDYAAEGYPVQSELEPISHEDLEDESKKSSQGKEDRAP